VLSRRTVRLFTDKQIDLVETFADQAVIAIENVRLFEEIQEKSCQLAEASQHKSQFLANLPLAGNGSFGHVRKGGGGRWASPPTCFDRI
jgi:two-component system, NtrC family, sensor kinase